MLCVKKVEYMNVSQFLNKRFSLLNANKLAFNSIVRGANFTHSLTRSFPVNFAANPLTVYIALSFEHLQICFWLSHANNKIQWTLLSNVPALLPLTGKSI